MAPLSSKHSKKSDNNKKTAGKKMPAVLKKAAIVIAIILTAFIVVYIGIAYLYYGSRFLPGTVINDKDYSNVSVNSLAEEIDTSIDNYELNICKNGEITDTLKGTDIDLLSTDTVNAVENACIKQNKLMWGIYIFGGTENAGIDNAVTYNEEKFNSVVDSLNIIAMQPTSVSENARLEFSDDKYNIIPAKYGDEIDKTKFIEAVSNAVLAFESNINVEDADCYIKPEITEDSEALVNACNKANNILNKNVEMTAFSNKTAIDKSVVQKWIKIDENFNVVPNEDEINNYVSSLDSIYTSYKKDRQFKTGSGNVVTVKGGDYGRALNTDDLKTQLTSIITDDNTTGFVLNFSRGAMGSVENDIGTTYVEVDLTNQHLYMFVEGNLVVETDVVTGKPDGTHDTPQGTYKLKYKQLDATLNGPGYSTPVAYWMPFNGDIGLHDATWQPRFGTDRYITGGSHGCVNLPLDAAKSIYEYAVVGMPVVCYFNVKSY